MHLREAQNFGGKYKKRKAHEYKRPEKLKRQKKQQETWKKEHELEKKKLLEAENSESCLIHCGTESFSKDL